ncbi:MAG: manganese efflux pump [Mogibacterium sp.]|nr:manganese efflux pump [Mogibacterium sp.]
MLLGAALAMDAFSVSIANGMANKCMTAAGVLTIAGAFAVFQFAMPMIGWFLVHTAVGYLEWFEKFVPWIALVLLSLIGGRMIKGGIDERRRRNEAGGSDIKCSHAHHGELGFAVLMVQGVATSIDALSVGFTTVGYGAAEAFLSAIIIGVTTFCLCTVGCLIGKKAGDVLSWQAGIFGGLIIIAIGVKIFI